jgi:DNA-binding GntR family transcriptional regulator
VTNYEAEIRKRNRGRTASQRDNPGEIPPGERIIEDALAEQFSISRTPLREAIHELEQNGLLVRGAHRGLFVAKMTITEANELYDMRAYLEGLAALNAAKKMTADDREELKRRYDLSFFYNPKTGKTEVVDRCAWLHPFILERCGHSICREYIQKLSPRLARYQHLARFLRGTEPVTHREHSIIIECLLAKDSFGSELAMRSHVQISGQITGEFLSKLVAHPDDIRLILKDK